jgi:hypothetical protein
LQGKKKREMKAAGRQEAKSTIEWIVSQTAFPEIVKE